MSLILICYGVLTTAVWFEAKERAVEYYTPLAIRPILAGQYFWHRWPASKRAVAHIRQLRDDGWQVSVSGYDADRHDLRYLATKSDLQLKGLVINGEGDALSATCNNFEYRGKGVLLGGGLIPSGPAPLQISKFEPFAAHSMRPVPLKVGNDPLHKVTVNGFLTFKDKDIQVTRATLPAQELDYPSVVGAGPHAVKPFSLVDADRLILKQVHWEWAIPLGELVPAAAVLSKWIPQRYALTLAGNIQLWFLDSGPIFAVEGELEFEGLKKRGVQLVFVEGRYLDLKALNLKIPWLVKNFALEFVEADLRFDLEQKTLRIEVLMDPKVNKMLGKLAEMASDSGLVGTATKWLSGSLIKQAGGLYLQGHLLFDFNRHRYCLKVKAGNFPLLNLAIFIDEDTLGVWAPINLGKKELSFAGVVGSWQEVITLLSSLSLDEAFLELTSAREKEDCRCCYPGDPGFTEKSVLQRKP